MEIMEIPFIWKLIRAIIILIIAKILNKIINHTFEKEKLRTLIHIKFIKNIIRAVIWTIAIAMVASQFSSLSKVTNTVLAGSGIITIIIGLAAQESFANVLSGLFIAIFKPFNIGDRISIVGDDITGFIEDITLRHTVIKTYMNTRVIIPNSVMNSCKIINTTYTKGGSYQIKVTIAYEDKDKRHRAKELLEEIVTSHPLFYDNRTSEDISNGKKATEALCTSLGESGIDFTILMWTENISDNPKACSDCRMEILDRFEDEGIEIPYNKIQILENT